MNPFAGASQRVTLSFYAYHAIENPNALRDELLLAWSRLEVLGRIYVAAEGVNAQMSVPQARFTDLRAHLQTFPFLKNVRLNLAVESSDDSFGKLKIKVRRKIVADGIEDPGFDPSRTGPHIRAREFNQMIGRPDTLLVDMRNHFESEIGHFQGALTPDVDTFRASLDQVTEALRDHREDRNLVMYCTGGIRCEKASAYFLHKGFRNVFQLEGGIIEYLRQVKTENLQNRFLGKNFVFDSRMAERISDDVVARCHQCENSCDTHHNCDNEACHILLIQCPACAVKFDGCCSDRCKSVKALPESERKALRRGRENPVKYFRRAGISR